MKNHCGLVSKSGFASLQSFGPCCSGYASGYGAFLDSNNLLSDPIVMMSFYENVCKKILRSPPVSSSRATAHLWADQDFTVEAFL